jgi:hypothetical protein
VANPSYTDDPTIPDEAELWRRIPAWHFYYDPNLQRVRPASSAFDDDDDGSPMSVVLAAESAGPDSVLAGHTGYALAAFTAELARQCNQGVVRDPLPEEPAHALVFGRKTDSVKSRFAKRSTWVVPPPLP